MSVASDWAEREKRLMETNAALREQLRIRDEQLQAALDALKHRGAIPCYVVVNWDENPKRFSCVHPTFDEAKTEAFRLARQNPEKSFAVLAMVGHAESRVEKKTLPATWYAEEPCPF